MTIYLGKVSYDLHDQASRVRVQIDGTDGIPLSVKASLNNYPRPLFKKGVAVEVEQAKHDGRVFRVTQVFEPVRKSVHVQVQIKVPDVRAFRVRYPYEDKTVRFWISSRYSNDIAAQLTMGRVLVKVLAMRENEANALLAGQGFWIICRESQFARFLIERNEEGLPNLFQALKVEYYTTSPRHAEIDVTDR